MSRSFFCTPPRLLHIQMLRLPSQVAPLQSLRRRRRRSRRSTLLHPLPRRRRLCKRAPARSEPCIDQKRLETQEKTCNFSPKHQNRSFLSSHPSSARRPLCLSTGKRAQTKCPFRISSTRSTTTTTSSYSSHSLPIRRSLRHGPALSCCLVILTFYHK